MTFVWIQDDACTTCTPSAEPSMASTSDASSFCFPSENVVRLQGRRSAAGVDERTHHLERNTYPAPQLRHAYTAALFKTRNVRNTQTTRNLSLPIPASTFCTALALEEKKKKTTTTTHSQSLPTFQSSAPLPLVSPLSRILNHFKHIRDL